MTKITASSTSLAYYLLAAEVFLPGVPKLKRPPDGGLLFACQRDAMARKQIGLPVQLKAPAGGSIRAKKVDP